MSNLENTMAGVGDSGKQILVVKVEMKHQMRVFKAHVLHWSPARLKR